MIQSRHTDNLKANIKNADPESAKKITDILYRMVDKKEIESFQIKEITKGKNSIDLSPFIPILEEVDFETLYKIVKDHGLFAISQGYIGLRIIREILSVVREGIEISEKFKEKKSQFGVSYKINRHLVLKYGRSFGVDPFDTILTSATSSTIEDTLLAKNQWGEIPIAREKYPLIQYIAFFVKTPVRAIQWIGKVKTISYNPETQKSTIYLDGNPEKTRLVPYDKKCPRHNGHGTVYTTLKRIKKAKTLCDVYPSLDKN